MHQPLLRIAKSDRIAKNRANTVSSKNLVTPKMTASLAFRPITVRKKAENEYAKENHYDLVSTTLTISPYQKHEIIKNVGKKLEDEYGIKFIYLDYREHFREGQKMAREDCLYMQKYCGCVFSFDEGKWVY